MSVNLASGVVDRRIENLPVRAVERRRAFGVNLHRDLGALAAAWREFERTGASTAYQHLAWLEPVCAHLAAAENATPLFAEVTRDGRAILLVPLVLRRRRGVRAIEWLDLGVCDYAAPLVAPGYRPNEFEADDIFRAILAALPPADLISIQRIPETLGTEANPLACLSCARPMGLEAFGLPIDGDPDTVVARVTTKSLARDLRRDAKRLLARGDVALVEARDVATVETIFDALVRQRRQRFEAAGRFDLLARPEVERFYRDGALRGARREGPARLFGLRIGEEWAACAYVLVDQRSLYGILLSIGGDQWRNTSPGLQLVSRLIAWSRGEGLAYFDMTIGDLPYKARFSAERRRLLSVAVPLTARGHLVVAATRTGAAAKRWMENRPALFERARGLRQAIRRAWR